MSSYPPLAPHPVPGVDLRTGELAPAPSLDGCAMITSPDTDGECGRFPQYRYKDGVHCICAECWGSLDEDIAAEYEPIEGRT
jgi:hypothetical protein